MSQNKYQFGNYTGLQRQPTEVVPRFAVTSTEESGRVQTGVMYNSPMFTVESYQIKFGKITGEDLSGLLTEIVGKPSFMFYHFNVFRNVWENTPFYAANIDCSNVYVKDGKEFMDSLSFQVTGINPV